MMEKIAVVILNYNSAADCRKCVASLRQQEGVELEIVIVDNCSRAEEADAAWSVAREQGCTFIAAGENRGYNAGNNVGLRHAAGLGCEYALIANPDMEFPERGYVARLAAEMRQRPDVAVVGSDIVTPEGIHQNPMMRDGDWRSSFGWIKSFFRKKKADTYDFIDNYAESHYCSKVSGCCLLVRMDFMERIGYFDERVFLYCEEAILSRQVEREGKKMYYIADARAIHAHVKSEKGDPVARFRHWKRSRIYFIKRYSDDSWIGKQLACLSMRTYVIAFIVVFRLKKILKK